MNFYILGGPSDSYEKLGIIDTYQSAIWNPMYYGQGAFEMTLPATPKHIELLQAHRLIIRESDEVKDGNVLRYNNPMVVKEIQYTHDDENGAIMIVRGVSLKSHVLGSRVINEYTVLSGNAEEQIYNVVENNLESTWYRAWPNLKNAELKHFTETTELKLFGENIATWMEETCRRHRFGWDMYILKSNLGASIYFELYKGEDRTEGNSKGNIPIIFSKEHDNLIRSELTINFNDFATNCLVAGTNLPDSEDKWHIMTDYPYGQSYPTGDERYEIYLDSGISPEDVEGQYYPTVLNNAGLQELAQRKVISLTAEIVPYGMYTLDKDYFLGDIVEVRTEYGIKAKARIEDIIYSIDQNGTSVDPTFGDWEVIE